MPPASNPLLALLDEKIPAPRTVGHASIMLETPSRPAGEQVGAPCWLWVRKGDLIIHRGGRGEYRGTLKMLKLSNADKAGVARTAALIGEENASFASDILCLAALRTLGRLSRPLSPACEEASQAILPRLGATSSNMFWRTKALHTLPSEPKDLKDIEDASQAAGTIRAWLDKLARDYVSVQMIGRSSERKGIIRSGAYLGVIGDFEGAARYAVAGSEEWQRLTTAELQALINEFSASALQRRFGVSRSSIIRACDRKGISRKKQAPGGRARSSRS